MLDVAPVDFCALIICHPDPAEVIVQPSTDYKYSVPKSDTYKNEESLIGAESIIHSEGETWKNLRRRFNPGFQPKYLLTLAPIIVAQTRTFIDRLKAVAASGGIIALNEYTQDLTTDIITQLAVNKNLHAQATPQGTGEKGPLGVLYASRLLPSLCHPNGRGLALPAPMLALKSRFYESLYDSKVTKWVSAQAELMQSPQHSQKAETERSISQLAMAGLPPNTGLIKNTVHQIKSFIFAGQDTTSTLVQWMAYELSKATRCPCTRHTAILRQLRAEHESVFGPGAFSALDVLSEPGAAEQILPARLPYTTAFVKETLRLHPPAGTARLLPDQPAFPIPLTDPTTHETRDVDIAGTRVYICQWILHRSAAVWGPDAKLFRPDRWLDENYMASLPVGAWRPFERGPRNCVGQELALTEGKIVLAAMARGLAWEKVGLGSRCGADAVGSGEDGREGECVYGWGKGEKVPEEEREVWYVWKVTSVPADGMRMKVGLVGESSGERRQEEIALILES